MSTPGEELSKQAEQSKKRVIFKDIEEEVKRIEVEKNIYARVLKINGELMLDVRRFYREFPTKKGVRISMDSFNNIKNLL